MIAGKAIHAVVDLRLKKIEQWCTPVRFHHESVHVVRFVDKYLRSGVWCLPVA